MGNSIYPPGLAHNCVEEYTELRVGSAARYMKLKTNAYYYCAELLPAYEFRAQVTLL